MNCLKNKVDFVALLAVDHANPNGDPLNGNRPRTDYDGFGEMSAECIKRKIRNRMQESHNIFVQSEDRKVDECKSLKERAEKELGKADKKTDREAYAIKACEKWLDVRAFGQVFAFSNKKGGDDEGGVSVGVRGPVSIHQAVSVSPVQVCSMQITKSVNGNPDEKRASDTMGMKHFVRFGLYLLKGSINVQLAEKTGFTYEDAQVVKECLRTLFENDASSARPEGSMEVVKLYWFEHDSKSGQYSTARVHRSVKVVQKNPMDIPTSVDDYEITLEELPGLTPEIIDGL